MLKYVFDRVSALSGLILTAPVLVVISLLIAWESGFPVLYRHRRVGRAGQPFSLLKFRSMRNRASGREITIAGDDRVTRVGRFLRQYKLDELPQLWNVLRGEMSMVGPRPEVARYVDLTSPVWQAILTVRPGITDPASVLYRNEEALLATAEDPEQFYRETVLPAKLAASLRYVRCRSFWFDLRLILTTIRLVARPSGRPPSEAALFPRHAEKGTAPNPDLWPKDCDEIEKPRSCQEEG